jgi:hypothetical protein
VTARIAEALAGPDAAFRGAADEREYRYAGCDDAIRHVRRCSPPLLEQTRVLLDRRGVA